MERSSAQAHTVQDACKRVGFLMLLCIDAVHLGNTTVTTIQWYLARSGTPSHCTTALQYATGLHAASCSTQHVVRVLPRSHTTLSCTAACRLMTQTVTTLVYVPPPGVTEHVRYVLLSKRAVWLPVAAVCVMCYTSVVLIYLFGQVLCEVCSAS
eukprot:18023-Heterococcus_DN1.PRE.2